MLGACAAEILRCREEAILGNHTRCWSGFGNCTTSKTVLARGRPRPAASFVLPNRFPCWTRSEAYLTELARTMLPKSSLAKAVTYARNQWAALRRYTEDGRLTIDNNVSERTLRHQAIGRKNWLFLGSEAAGPRAAVLCTILAGAKRHRIEPWCYVRELLLRLHADDPRLDEMLPDRWAAAHPEAVLTHRLDESRAKAARTRASSGPSPRLPAVTPAPHGPPSWTGRTLTHATALRDSEILRRLSRTGISSGLMIDIGGNHAPSNELLAGQRCELTRHLIR